MLLLQFQSSFFQNEEIFVKLDELDELDRINHAWIGVNYSLTQAQKTVGVMVKEPDCQASNLGSIPGQVSEFFVNLILLNSSN